MTTKKIYTYNKIPTTEDIENAITENNTKFTLQTTAPTSAITDGGIHIVILDTAPTTEYDGYIYLIKES